MLRCFVIQARSGMVWIAGRQIESTYGQVSLIVKAEPQAGLARAWGPKRDGTWGEQVRGAPSCLQIEARSIDSPLNLNFELNEKPGPDRKLRATLLWRRQEAAP